MSFFGLTALGSPNHFLSGTTRGASHRPVDLSSFQEQFARLALPSEDAVPRVRKADVPRLISDALGRELSLQEMDLLLRHFDTGPGRVAWEELLPNLEKLFGLSSSCDPAATGPFAGETADPSTSIGAASLHTSNLQVHEDRHRHKRSVLGPTEMYNKPMTANQEYGWMNQEAVPVAERDVYVPRTSTEVTQKEGISSDTLYGKI